ncbi:hypothetical protein [Marinimicrobium koreense]|uniref:hypothetical protein n=1 Tax=Marinimicrobium koreense TaxID=306545 RepID=UPI003F6EA9AA
MTFYMNEYQRQAYLDALGMEQYVPRWLMPHAPMPTACELPMVEPPSEAPALAREPATERAPAETPRPVADFLNDMREPAKPTRREAPPEPERVAAAEPPAERIEPFTLSIWRSPLPILVVDARQPRAAMPTDRLLRNLLQALAPHDSQRVSEEVLPWPLVNHKAVRLSADDARAELSTWLETELTNRPVRHLLLMGESAARFLLPEDKPYGEVLWQSLPLSPFDMPTLVAPSLLEILRNPDLKRPLWAAVQPWLPMDVPAS